MPDGHRIILHEFLSTLESDIHNILDWGSGKTSLGILLSKFENRNGENK